MALMFKTQKLFQRLCGAMRSRQAAEAKVEVVGEAQKDLATTSDLDISFAHLERRMLIMLLLQTALLIGAVASIEVLVGN